jgi:exopolyphosphatase/pppGpp-phosphohydrolase
LGSSSEFARGEEIDRSFAIASGIIGAANKLTLLRIGSEKTVLATGTSDLRINLFELNIGRLVTSRAFFRSEMPGPAEVEDAINFIEEELMKAKTLAESPSELITFDAEIRSIAAEAGAADETHLGRQAMEELFTRYALISMGRPEAFDTLKMDREFFANLLILREVMHHLGFEKIRIAD